MSITERTTALQSDSAEIASAILGEDLSIVWAEDLRPGDVIEHDGQSRRVETVLAHKVPDRLVIAYRPVRDIRRAERTGLPICDLPVDEFYAEPTALIVRRLRDGLVAA